MLKEVKNKGMGAIFVVLLLVVVLMALFVGYKVFIYPQKHLEKARKPDSSLKTESKLLPARTKIEAKGYNLELSVSPSQNDVVSGEVVVEITKLPEGVKHIGFSMDPSFEKLGEGGPNLGFDSDGSNGWSLTLDTKSYENGQYYIAAFAFPNDAISDPVGVVNTLVEIRN